MSDRTGRLDKVIVEAIVKVTDCHFSSIMKVYGQACTVGERTAPPSGWKVALFRTA